MRRKSNRRHAAPCGVAGIAAVYLSVGAAAWAAPAPPIAGIGTALSPTDLNGMVAIPPDGKGLPPGQGSVSQGAAVYAQGCAGCHGEDLQGRKEVGAPPLIGGRGTLTALKPLKTVESYWPYATTLFDYIHRAMPMNAPGSLPDDQVYAVSAYILARAGIIGQDAVLDAKSLIAVRMPNRDGFSRAAGAHGVEP